VLKKRGCGIQEVRMNEERDESTFAISKFTWGKHHSNV